jgi:hypothetical protein
MNTKPTGGRLAAIIIGGVLASFALLTLAAGAGFAWLDDRKDADGYYMTSSEHFSTSTYALATDNLEVDDDLPGDLTGTVRVDARPAAGKPVFVGIARARDVQDYLAMSAHETLTDIDVDPFVADYRASDGTRAPGVPSAQDFWVARAQGSGQQQLEWDVEDGDWSVVVMNADGSAAIDAQVAVGSDLPLVGTLATALLITGGLGVITGSALIAGGFIAPRRRALAA